MDVDHLIEEQIDYYRNRAVEYDETSRPVYDSLAEYGNELAAALDRFQPGGARLSKSQAERARGQPNSCATRRMSPRWTHPPRCTSKRGRSSMTIHAFGSFMTLGSALRPAGRVLLIDELPDTWSEDVVAAGETPVVHRSLRDGRRFRVVKGVLETRAILNRGSVSSGGRRTFTRQARSSGRMADEQVDR